MVHNLITVAVGCIGGRVNEMLIIQGQSVTGMDNLNGSYGFRMIEYRLQKLQALSGFTFVILDISDPDSVTRHPDIVTPRFDAAINLAVHKGVRASLKTPWIFFETNLTGTLNLLELCRQHSTHEFVQASTSTIYGREVSPPNLRNNVHGQPPQA